MNIEKALLLLVVVSIGYLESGHARHLDIQWKEFKETFNKTYPHGEESYRRQIWEENVVAIEKHNKMADDGKYKFWLKMNHFGDLTTEEANDMMYGLNVFVNVSTVLPYQRNKVNSSSLPNHVDWRLKGYVTKVKDQGSCGSCYAFATTGALEGQHFRKYGKLVSLSEQNILDCTWNYGNKGCQGGKIDGSFQYVIVNGGIDTEASYPYEGVVQRCRYMTGVVGSACWSYEDIPKGDEEALQEAVAKKGPVAVGVNAKGCKFKYYSHGVYDNPACSSKKLTHAVLVVGYGTRNGEDYWLVKNSWGALWGENGYMEMSRNKHNQCGIASQASYPIL